MRLYVGDTAVVITFGAAWVAASYSSRSITPSPLVSISSKEGITFTLPTGASAVSEAELSDLLLAVAVPEALIVLRTVAASQDGLDSRLGVVASFDTTGEGAAHGRRAVNAGPLLEVAEVVVLIRR